MIKSITEPYGLAYQISELGYEEDDIIELLCSIDAINGITRTISDNGIQFTIKTKRGTFVLFDIFEPSYDLKLYLDDLTYYVDNSAVFLYDISTYLTGSIITLDDALRNQDKLILAVRRLLFTVLYEQ